MNNKKLLDRLYKIGKLPPAEIADQTNFPLKEFDKILQKIKLPIDFETALKLINLSPQIGEGCHEVEWAIISWVENYQATDEKYKELLDKGDEGEIKKILEKRFENYLKNKTK
ncbi:hypothetical protein AGMMS50293_31130 [Spirochaetia bacterium]|nr:hypothetical protein AGMMS50293_31130 [Spirochaetia bacterium]